MSSSGLLMVNCLSGADATKLWCRLAEKLFATGWQLLRLLLLQLLLHWRFCMIIVELLLPIANAVLALQHKLQRLPGWLPLSAAHRSSSTDVLHLLMVLLLLL